MKLINTIVVLNNFYRLVVLSVLLVIRYTTVNAQSYQFNVKHYETEEHYIVNVDVSQKSVKVKSGSKILFDKKYTKTKIFDNGIAFSFNNQEPVLKGSDSDWFFAVKRASIGFFNPTMGPFVPAIPLSDSEYETTYNYLVNQLAAPQKQFVEKIFTEDTPVKELKEAAEAGNTDAQFYLAYKYSTGYGVGQNVSEAVKWYRKAAEQGYGPAQGQAQYNLGYCYSVGKGVEKNYTEAVKWYRKAAEQGNLDGLYSMGLCYERGEGVKQDYVEAVKYYKKGAELGDSHSQHNLGVCYYYGKGVEKNIELAKSWVQKAANQGLESAKKTLDGINGYTVVARTSISFDSNMQNIEEPRIEFPYETPTAEQLAEWKEKYSSYCAKSKSIKKDDYRIPKDMLKNHPCLVYMIFNSESLVEPSERQSWFDLYSLMDEEKINKLYDILYRESYKLNQLYLKDVQSRTFYANGVPFNMVFVQGGTFSMGATKELESDAYSWEKPVHNVTLDDFYLGQTEVTQKLWAKVMGKNPSRYENSNNPVVYVSWEDCQVFIQKLNEITGQNFRLPTEAEWEFAARGGNKSKGYKYAGGNVLDRVAWNGGDTKTHNVAIKFPNELGIYDMSGNVWEWCNDWVGDYSRDDQINPKGPSSGTTKVYRGGSYADEDAKDYRVSVRGIVGEPEEGMANIGLRLAL